MAARELDAIIQCTPLGLGDHGGDGKRRPLRPDCFLRNQVVVDIVYRPLNTPFLRAASDRGAKVVGGLGMLVYQGAENFRIWTGAKMPVEKIRWMMEEVLAEEGRDG